jgi:hypothetical protein
VRQPEVGEITPTRVTQGSTFNNKEEKFVATNAVDKDLTTRAATEHVTTDSEGWIKFELGKNFLVHKILIYYRFYTNWYDPSGWCEESEERFKKCVDDNNNVDVSVYQGDVKQKSCGTLKLTYGLEQSDQIYTLICNTEGDTVKLSKDTGNIAVFEVVIIAEQSKNHDLNLADFRP